MLCSRWDAQYCCYTKNKSVLFQSHILSAMDFRAAICWFAPAENHPTHKMYGSVSNICAWKSVESLNGKRFFTSIVKNVLGDFFGLKENHFALQLQGSFILDYQLCRCEEANCRKFGYLIVSYMVIFIKI